MSEGTFSPKGYRVLIEALLSQGYQVRDFFSVEAKARHLVLRHDIDVSLTAAIAMAEIEKSMGISSCYFVRVTGPFYNPAAPEGRSALDRLLALGHEVGLHFDAALVEDRIEAQEAAAARECTWLESLLGRPVRILSFHRPAKSLLTAARPLAGRANTYEPRFFHDIGYCSDSRGAFHHGEPQDHPAIREGRALQLLSHPIWWVAPAGNSPAERLERFLEAHTEGMRRALGQEIAGFQMAGPS